MTLRFFCSIVSMAIGLVLSMSIKAEVPKILPLGDSITAGWSQPSYRLPLSRSLEQRNCNVDFVGNQVLTSHTPLTPDKFPGLHFPSFSAETHPGYPAGEHWDPAQGDDTDHAGYPGAKVADLLPVTLGEVRSAQPDYVLLHIGTNDVLKAYEVHTEDEYARFSIETVRSLNQIIKTILSGHRDPANIKILLANLIPVDPDDSEQTYMDEFAISNTLRRYIEALAEGQNDPRLILVDVATGFDIEKMTTDGIHPNAIGERHIAKAFFNTLIKLGLCG